MLKNIVLVSILMCGCSSLNSYDPDEGNQPKEKQDINNIIDYQPPDWYQKYEDVFKQVSAEKLKISIYNNLSREVYSLREGLRRLEAHLANNEITLDEAVSNFLEKKYDEESFINYLGALVAQIELLELQIKYKTYSTKLLNSMNLLKDSLAISPDR